MTRQHGGILWYLGGVGATYGDVEVLNTASPWHLVFTCEVRAVGVVEQSLGQSNFCKHTRLRVRQFVFAPACTTKQ